MKAYKVTITSKVNDFVGEDRYFSSYEKAVGFIFLGGYDFYVRSTNIKETPEGLKEKLHEGYIETIRRVSQPNELFPCLERVIEYCHITIISID